jgi:hypothetical protein
MPETLSEKQIKKAKGLGDDSSGRAFLPSKNEALSSILSTAKQTTGK